MFTATISAVSNVAHGHAELSDGEAWALTQFVKCVGWIEMLSKAVDKAEAEECTVRSRSYSARCRTQASHLASCVSRAPAVAVTCKTYFQWQAGSTGSAAVSPS